MASQIISYNTLQYYYTHNAICYFDLFLAETFHDSRRLHILKLAGNNISSIDNCALCNTTLEELDVSSNAMTDINENMFSWVNIPKFAVLKYFN